MESQIQVNPLTEIQSNLRSLLGVFFRRTAGTGVQEHNDEKIHPLDPHRPGGYRHEPLGIITNHIRIKQHQIVNVDIPAIREQFAVVVQLHFTSYPDIARLRESFLRLAEKLGQVGWLDTRGILAYTNEFADDSAGKMHVAKNRKMYAPELMAGSLKMHLAIARELSAIIESGFAVTSFTTIDPEYNHLLQALNNLEDDLQSLAHLKLNILFPRVVRLEKLVRLPAAVSAGTKIAGTTALYCSPETSTGKYGPDS